MCLRKAWLHQVQSLLHNFHMLPQVQLCPSIASYIDKYYRQNTKQQGSNKREQQQTVHIILSQALSYGEFKMFLNEVNSQ